MTPWTVACQAPLSMEFSRQECWNGLPFPLTGDLPDQGRECVSPALAGMFFTTESPGKTIKMIGNFKYNGNQLKVSSHKSKGGLVMKEKSVPGWGIVWHKYPGTKEK